MSKKFQAFVLILKTSSGKILKYLLQNQQISCSCIHFVSLLEKKILIIQPFTNQNIIYENELIIRMFK